MNNFLLQNNDLFYALNLPFPQNNPTLPNNYISAPHFQTNYEPTESCTTINSSFQPSFKDQFPFNTPKKDVFTNWTDYEVPSLSELSEASCSFYKPVPVNYYYSNSEPTKENINSKYLQAVREIFADVSSFVLADSANSLHEPSFEPVQNSGVSSNEEVLMEGKIVQNEINEQREKLLSMLQLIDERYNNCLDQIQNLTSKFKNPTDSNQTLNPNPAPFAHLSISSLYKNLRERITSEIISISQQKKRENEKEKGFEFSFIKQWASQQKEKMKRTESQSWRPQRGLPEKSVSVLRAWMFQNFLRPYPNDNEKDLLAIKAGLSRSQVSNWFINARVRLWKPMIEEMYAELNKMKENEDLSSIHASNNN